MNNKKLRALYVVYIDGKIYSSAFFDVKMLDGFIRNFMKKVHQENNLRELEGLKIKKFYVEIIKNEDDKRKTIRKGYVY